MLNESETRDLERRGFSPEQIGLMQTEFDGLGGKDTWRKGGELLDADRAQRERVEAEEKLRPHREAQQQVQQEESERYLRNQHSAARQRWLTDMQQRAQRGDRAAADALASDNVAQQLRNEGRAAVLGEIGQDLSRAVGGLDIPSDVKARLLMAPSISEFATQLRKAPAAVQKKVAKSLSDYAPGAMAELGYQPREPGWW